MIEETVIEVKSWLTKIRHLIIERLQDPLIVEHKTSKADVVTNVDKEIEHYLIQKIRKKFPEDQILGEEGIGEPVTDFSGRVWIVDPIDGTLNFVKQHDHFCVMLALYEDGVGQLGFIYEVMRDELLWGGKQIGVFLNDQQITEINNEKLTDGILNINTHMFLHNHFNGQDIALKAIGVRMIGCAGIAFKEVITGKQNAYLSYLEPWDYAAGKVLADELGLVVQSLDEQPLDLEKRAPVIVAVPKTYEDIQEIRIM